MNHSFVERRSDLHDNVTLATFAPFGTAIPIKAFSAHVHPVQFSSFNTVAGHFTRNRRTTAAEVVLHSRHKKTDWRLPRRVSPLALSHIHLRITGFLLGTSIAAAYGYYYLLTTLSTQSTLLNGAISDLQTSTAALQSYISKIDSLEQDFKKLEGKVVDKEGIGEIRGEFKKAIGGVRGEGLELKERIAGLGILSVQLDLLIVQRRMLLC